MAGDGTDRGATQDAGWIRQDGVGFWSWDLRDGAAFWSQELRRIFGLGPAARPPDSLERFAELVHPEDRAQVLARVRETISERRPGHAHAFRIFRADGAVRHVFSRARLTCDPDGRPAALSGVDLDVTEEACGAPAPPSATPGAPGRRAQINGGPQQEALLRAFIDNSASYIFAKNLEGRYLLANRHYLDAFGETEADVIGRTDVERFGEGEPFSTNDSLVAETGEAIEFEESARAADGAPIHAISIKFPLRDAQDRLFGVGSISTDITRRKLAEAALAESEARFRAITEAMPQLVWSARPDGRRDFFNTRWHEFTGTPVDSDGEALWRDLVPEKDRERIERRWLRSIRTGEPFEIEHRLRHRSGELRWLLCRALPVRDPAGRIIRWMGTCTDIHEMKVAQEHRKLLLSELDHRVKNTLAIVQVVARQSLREGVSPEEARESFSGRIDALASAHDILTQESWSGARLGELVRAALRGCGADQERMEVEGPEVVLTAKQGVSMAMAMHELCTNAAKHGALSAPEGRIEVRWRMEGGPEPRLRLTWRERGGPPAAQPRRRGFGSRMIEKALAIEFGGQVTLEFPREGVICRIDAPLGPQG